MSLASALITLWPVVVIVGGYPETEPPKEERSGVVAGYQPAVERIVSAVLKENDAYEKLEHLCVRIGHRLSGSAQLEHAIQWAAATLRRDGAVKVRREKVMVPHWVRGNESLMMLKPRRERLAILGLGGSVGTPPEGVTGEVIVVEDEAELARRSDEVAGKIVLFNKAMPPYDPVRGSGYGTAVKYRVHGARLAAEHGAIAALVRSVTAGSLYTPHTGGMRYGDAKRKIPTAAVTIEDAETFARLRAMGVPVEVNLKMAAKTLPDAESANVVGELRGREWPEEIVVIGGHIDSWDVGHGAHDDAGGCVIAMEVINVLRKLEMIPRRTIRVVLWTNEENGLRGGRQYVADHAEEMENHVAAIESDSGVFAPRGYSIDCADEEKESAAARQLREILSLFPRSVGPLDVRLGGSGADVSPMKQHGVALMGHRVEGSTYFHYHHTAADTIDKVDPQELSENVAVLAAVAYVLADMPTRLGEPAMTAK